MTVSHSLHSESFDHLGLPAALLAAVRLLGWEKPTPVQAQSIPPALAGHDVLARAQTGTGKTGAFALPMCARFAHSDVRAVRGLVLCPTRELALQIEQVFTVLGPKLGVTSAVLIGGASMRSQISALAEHPMVVVATPGRLLDHLEHKHLTLDNVEMLVFDEADRMLDMGFLPQINRILDRVTGKQQTMLFSATLPSDIERIIRKHLKEPVRVDIATSMVTADRVDQKVYLVDHLHKRQALLALLENVPGSTLVFTRMRRHADQVAKFLEQAGVQIACIHSDLSQPQRKRSLEHFRDEKVRVLVATDIVSRGIDVDHIAHVINFNVPQSPDDYVHRIGRTARADRAGHASTLASPEEFADLRAIEDFIGKPIPRGTLKDVAIVAEQPKTLARGRGFGKRQSKW